MSKFKIDDKVKDIGGFVSTNGGYIGVVTGENAEYTLVTFPNHPKEPTKVWYYEEDELELLEGETEEMTTEQTKEYKTWSKMTAEEKGALLLARHEGKTIQYTDLGDTWWETINPQFLENLIYRVKPEEPKVEEKVFDEVYVEDGLIPYTYSVDWGDRTKGAATVTYTDGKPTKMVWECI